MAVDYSDLELAFDFVSSGYEFEHTSWINKESGEIYYISDSSDDVLPDDCDESEAYIEIPDKRGLGLGKPLAIEFTQINLPDNINHVYSIFQSRGAYSRFKDLLDDKEMLERWYEFEQESTKAKIIEWCNENGIEIG